jgi:hypothetical protein
MNAAKNVFKNVGRKILILPTITFLSAVIFLARVLPGCDK